MRRRFVCGQHVSKPTALHLLLPPFPDGLKAREAAVRDLSRAWEALDAALALLLEEVSQEEYITEGEETMRTCTDIIGKPIISIDNGINLGTVKDVYFDQPLEKLAGIFLRSEGLLKRKTVFIDAQNIVLFGHDAVLVNCSDVVKDSESSNVYHDWVRRERVIGRTIKTSGGTLIGSIGDVYLSLSGEVRALVLTRIQIDSPIASVGLIARDAVLEPGDDDASMLVDLAKAEQQSSDALRSVSDTSPRS